MQANIVKKIMSGIAIVALSASLVACGNSGSSNQVTSDNTQSNTVEPDEASETANSNTNQVSPGGDSGDEKDSTESTAEFKTVNFGDKITTDFFGDDN